MRAMMTRLPYATIIPSGVAGIFPVALTASGAGSVSAIVLELFNKMKKYISANNAELE